jgi:hypothetical protein
LATPDASTGDRPPRAARREPELAAVRAAALPGAFNGRLVGVLHVPSSTATLGSCFALALTR